MNRTIKGQEQVLVLLSSATSQDRIAQAYLFHGSDGSGKFLTALYFGMMLNCLAEEEQRPCGVCQSCRKFLALEHPDLIYLFPSTNLRMSAEGEIRDKEAHKEYDAYIQNKINTPWVDYFFSGNTEIRRDSMNLLIRRLELSKHEGRKRIVIIENCDMMNTQTANSFLKTLEEPPANTVIILTTERMSNILPTIISRCQPVYFKPLSQNVISEILVSEFGAESHNARSAARISGGNLKTAIRIAQNVGGGARDRAYELFEMARDDKALEYLTQLGKNRESADALIDHIANVQIIANDLAVFSIAAQEIINLDKAAWYQAFAQDELADRLPDYLLTLSDISRKLSGNVNPQLAMIKLFLSTKQFLGA